MVPYKPRLPDGQWGPPRARHARNGVIARRAAHCARAALVAVSATLAVGYLQPQPAPVGAQSALVSARQVTEWQLPRQARDEARGVLSRYLDCRVRADYRGMYQLLTSGDRRRLSLAEFQEQEEARRRYAVLRSIEEIYDPIMQLDEGLLFLGARVRVIPEQGPHKGREGTSLVKVILAHEPDGWRARSADVFDEGTVPVGPAMRLLRAWTPRWPGLDLQAGEFIASGASLVSGSSTWRGPDALGRWFDRETAALATVGQRYCPGAFQCIHRDGSNAVIRAVLLLIPDDWDPTTTGPGPTEVVYRIDVAQAKAGPGGRHPVSQWQITRAERVGQRPLMDAFWLHRLTQNVRTLREEAVKALNTFLQRWRDGDVKGVRVSTTERLGPTLEGLLRARQWPTAWEQARIVKWRDPWGSSVTLSLEAQMAFRNPGKMPDGRYRVTLVMGDRGEGWLIKEVPRLAPMTPRSAEEHGKPPTGDR